MARCWTAASGPRRGTWGHCARLLDAGVIVALATARDRASITGSVPLVRPGLFYLASGGALVYEVAADAIVWAEAMPPALAAEAVAFLQRFDQPVFVNADCDYWVDRDGDRVAMIEQRYRLRTQAVRAPGGRARGGHAGEPGRAAPGAGAGRS